MTSLKQFFAVSFGILGAVLLAPFVAVFGLIMLGLAFGLSLITAAAVATLAHGAASAAQKDTATDTQPA